MTVLPYIPYCGTETKCVPKHCTYWNSRRTCMDFMFKKSEKVSCENCIYSKIRSESEK